MFESIIWVMFIGVIVFLGSIYIQNYIDRVEKNEQITEYERLKLENEKLLNEVLKEIEHK